MKFLNLSVIILLSIVVATLSYSCERDCDPSTEYTGKNGGTGYRCKWNPKNSKKNCAQYEEEDDCHDVKGCVMAEMATGKWTNLCLGFCQACCSAKNGKCVFDDSAGDVEDRCAELSPTKFKKLRKYKK